MTRNTRTFPNPEVFNPDRYFNNDGTWNTDVLDPTTFAFGFGRRCASMFFMSMNQFAYPKLCCRMCPGRHFAIASIYIYAASILHVFNISQKRDVSGKQIEIERDMVSGVVTCVPRWPVRCSRLIEFADIRRDSNATLSLALPMRRLSSMPTGYKDDDVAGEETIRLVFVQSLTKCMKYEYDMHLYESFTVRREGTD